MASTRFYSDNIDCTQVIETESETVCTPRYVPGPLYKFSLLFLDSNPEDAESWIADWWEDNTFVTYFPVGYFPDFESYMEYVLFGLLRKDFPIPEFDYEGLENALSIIFEELDRKKYEPLMSPTDRRSDYYWIGCYNEFAYAPVSRHVIFQNGRRPLCHFTIKEICDTIIEKVAKGRKDSHLWILLRK